MVVFLLIKLNVVLVIFSPMYLSANVRNVNIHIAYHVLGILLHQHNVVLVWRVVLGQQVVCHYYLTTENEDGDFLFRHLPSKSYHVTVGWRTSKLKMRTCLVMCLNKFESQSRCSLLKMMYSCIAFYKWVSNDKWYCIIIVMVIFITFTTNCTYTHIFSKFYDLWYC